MQRLAPARSLLAAVVALAALAGGSAAQAHTDRADEGGLHLLPPAMRDHLQPAPAPAQPVRVQPQPQPLQVRPQPVLVQPAPVHVRPQPAYAQPAPVVPHPRTVRSGPWGDADRDGVPNRYDHDSRFHGRHAHDHGPWGDMDRDGVPNRYDRAPTNPYRR